MLELFLWVCNCSVWLTFNWRLLKRYRNLRCLNGPRQTSLIIATITIGNISKKINHRNMYKCCVDRWLCDVGSSTPGDEVGGGRGGGRVGGGGEVTLPDSLSSNDIQAGEMSGSNQQLDRSCWKWTKGGAIVGHALFCHSSCSPLPWCSARPSTNNHPPPFPPPPPPPIPISAWCCKLCPWSGEL